MHKIIDNKKVEMTNDEHRMYLAICDAHEPYGKSLFKDLFEVDEDGLIQYLKPPTKKFSLEVVVFLQNLMLHQHLRKIYREHDEALKEITDLISEVKKQLKITKNK